MFENSTANLRELSPQEQESLAAGQNSDFFAKSDFFLQKTDIQTDAENQLSSGGESNTQSSRYNLSQITIGTSVTFRWPQVTFSVDKWNSWMNNVLKDLLRF
ncbi:hypothetical protein [Nostoc sp. FACHB-280]|uniref:hypothetical protein n=1 Tax=Nostoc sp. FACHB-280 TaxID=2692839 RepID=UPI00168AF376|nr:hypothetical protein [Nostoc sp. FACHB-280]MBD2495070.1 hypothetical protein [Nostoc sp. FACHB-280]